MAHSKQAEKRLRQADKRKLQNKSRLSVMNTHMKRTQAAIDAKDATKATQALREAMHKIDKAAKHHTIHKNTAARRKSLLARRIAALAAK